MSDKLAVVADIGGTNTRVAFARGTTVQTHTIKRYRNADQSGIEPILRDFLTGTDARPEAVCIDMAGPVKNGTGQMTNLSWTITNDALAETTGAHTVSILNDLQAQGFAVAHLEASSQRPVLPGRPAEPDATRLVVNVGTGLNVAPVFRIDGRTVVTPAEAGHIAMPVQNEEELRLRDWVAAQHGTPSIEDVLSGRGFERIHAFLSHEDGDDSPALDAAAIMKAFETGDPRATHAAKLFVRFMGRYASDQALIALPFGGIYLVGGVVRHFGPHLSRLGFAESFADKGRFGPYMTQFPVHLVDDDYAALTGCASHLAERLAT
ncbi:ROK family protein [Pacificoceanicola onchidii]|uniref:glucokinase n=1 Tax=Pacificoceanicola onchidii TaxID=2562685 RepID=UPI0010A4E03F|nr:ROK family protein [Pacificoceanicola onchidii]